ncbi:MAG: fatty acid kinase fatty acid binding subunit [Clostridiales bacterium]|jgi:DegV family protein with EDD domain|nr:fatty acid kinase fatty acid binding subunit [Clostridiales bacterium]
MIKMIVDSTCDLPESYLRAHDVDVIPLRVLLDGKEYLDKTEIQIEDIYEAMRSDIMPITSQPKLQDIYALFRGYCQKGQDFIYLSFSSALSGTYQTAMMVLTELREQFPKVNMQVVDSCGGSTATGLVLMESIPYCESEQFSFPEVVGRINQMVSGIEHIFTLSSLSWLVKGGRIGKAKAFIGTALKINPILHVSAGRIEVLENVRGRKRALSRVVELMEERGDDLTHQVIGISHADDPSAAEALMSLIKNRVGDCQFCVNKIGGVLASHLGIGGVGVFFFNEKAQADSLQIRKDSE